VLWTKIEFVPNSDSRDRKGKLSVFSSKHHVTIASGGVEMPACAMV